MIPSGDLKIITLLRNALSVSIPALGLTWLWATKQEHWLKDFIEPTAMVVGALIIFCQFLIARWSGGQIIEKNKFYNIPNTQLHRNYLAHAKSSIADGKPDEALKTMSAIKVESVVTDVALLSGQWAERRRGQIADVLEHTDKSIQQINRDVLSLITTLEAEINTYGAVDREVRTYLQKRYTNRLEQKLAKRQPINLRRLPTSEGTSDETAKAFVTINAEEVKAHIVQVFQVAYGRLLITGKPGAGKTVLLLQLELALLESENDQLPVVLNLATWKKHYITLDPWLKEILPAELGVSKKYAADVLQQNRLILLLDGLDEVEEYDRGACLEAIGRYRAATDCRYVITSRIGEYSAISKDAPVNLQIEVGDLTLDQMEAELLRMGHAQPEAMPLLNALKKHPTLREAAQVPFYFNTLQLLFAGGKNLSDLGLKGHSAEEIQAELTLQFVDYALTIPFDKNYTSQQATRWLSFLAYNMTDRNKVVIEFVDFQYNWSPFGLNRWQLVVSHIIGQFASSSVPIGLFWGLTMGFYFGLVHGIAAAVFCFLFGSLSFGFLSSFLMGFFLGCLDNKSEMHGLKIETKESIQWSWSRYFQVFNHKFALIPFIFCIYITYFQNLISGLFMGFVLAITFSIFIFYLRSNSIATIQITHPYQRFKNSAKTLHFSILQHWHLMYLFSQKGWLPWSIVPFLNYMVVQQLLECPDGATWRFRHRILQEHFTKTWETIER